MLGGIILGAAGSWIYNKFKKRKSYIASYVSSINNHTHTQNVTTVNTSEGVYIQEDDETKFLTNSEFQRYFELSCSFKVRNKVFGHSCMKV